jgi:hypothetical protein
MRGQINAALTAVARTLHVYDVDAVAFDPPESIPATLEAIGPEQR